MKTEKLDRQPRFKQLHIEIQKLPLAGVITFVPVGVTFDNKRFYGEIVWSELKEAQQTPFFDQNFQPLQVMGDIEQPTLQKLMDDLWNLGIRPTEGAGTAGSMRVMENYLDDMRRLVFKDNYVPRKV